MTGLTLKLIGAEKIIKFFDSKDTVKKPVDEGLKKLANNTKRELIKATVVDTGTARANIASAPIQYGAFKTIVTYGSGPGQSYIPFLESGTPGGQMQARHMEGGSKIIGEGQGMFTFVRRWLEGQLDKAAELIGKDVEGKFGD